jgi:glycosyltransferase involved in cell wall biosynthesis
MTGATRPTVLILVEHYRPSRRFGGEGEAVHHLISALREDIEFKLITRNHDFGDPTPFPDVQTDRWQTRYGIEIFYMSPTTSTLSGIARLIRATEHDAVYLNGLYSPTFTLAPLLLRRLARVPARPWLLAPRGTALAGARARKKFKKSVFMAAAKAIGLYRNLFWHAINDREADSIRDLFGRRSVVHVATHALSVPTVTSGEAASPRKEAGSLRIVFLGRIMPVKNLTVALDVLRELSGDLTFDIYGPKEDAEYWRHCEAKIAALPDNIRVTYHGPVAPENVPATLSQHDLFIAPSAYENFGLAIVEAAASGCPVLVSERTPWRDLDKVFAGWVCDLSQLDQFSRVIETCVAMDNAEFDRWRRGAREFAAEFISGKRARKELRALFASALKSASDGRRHKL